MMKPSRIARWLAWGVLLACVPSCTPILGIEERELVTGGNSGNGGGDSVITCAPATCDDECVNTFADDANCGDCGVACAAGESCSAGTCDKRLGGGNGSWSQCARTDEAVYCWGVGTWGQLGTGTAFPGDVPEPQTVTVMPSDVLYAATGPRSTCFLVEDGSVRCVGQNSEGMLGIGTSGGPDDAEQPACCYLQPVEPLLPDGAAASDVVAGGYWDNDNFYCALLDSGDVYCWGREAETPVKKLSGAVQIGAGNRDACALLGNTEVWCWSSTSEGGVSVPAAPPYQVPGLPPIRAIGVAMQTMFAIGFDDKLYGWGLNEIGLLGPSATIGLQYYPPIEVELGFSERVLEIGGSRWVACARLAGGDVYCWGTNGYQGDGTPAFGIDPLPHKVPIPSAALELATSMPYVLARGADGNFYRWGGDKPQVELLELP